MKYTERLAFALVLLAVTAWVSGCATSEKPDFQGYKHSSPTVDDYYPSKTK